MYERCKQVFSHPRIKTSRDGHSPRALYDHAFLDVIYRRQVLSAFDRPYLPRQIYALRCLSYEISINLSDAFAQNLQALLRLMIWGGLVRFGRMLQ